MYFWIRRHFHPQSNAQRALPSLSASSLSRGVFIHLSPERAFQGAKVTLTGAIILVCVIAVLVYGLITLHQRCPHM